MENIKEFMDELSGEIMQMLPGDLTKDLSIDAMTVTKMNDQVLNGLTFQKKGEQASPTIYIDEEFRNHNEGKPMGMISGQVAQAYLDSLVMQPDTIPQELDLDKVRNDISFHVLEIKRNHKYLSEVPYMPMGNGLAAVCHIKVDDGKDGCWRTTITRAFAERNSCDMNEVFQAAMERAPEIDPPVLSSMESQLFGFDRENILDEGMIRDGEKSPMYVLTNESGMLGASALFYPGVQEKIAEAMGEGYSVLPSSVHEVLIVPDSLGPNAIELSEMVHSVNTNVLDPKDILSDNVFHYDKETKELSVAAVSIQMSDRKAEARC